MAFLNVLFAYLLSRFTVLSVWLQVDAALDRGFARLIARWPAGHAAFLVGPVVLTLVPGVLWFYLPFWSSAGFGLLVLLACICRGAWRNDLAGLPPALHGGKAEAVWLQLQSEGCANATDTDQLAAFWEGWCRHTARIYLGNLFAIFFWFLLSGPVGALFYRLVSAYCRMPAVHDNPALAKSGWLVALDWLPARYMALCACLAGNFTSGMAVWRRLLLDTRLPPDLFLVRCLDGALVTESAVAPLVAQDAALDFALQRHACLQDLLARTEIIGLVGIALAIVSLH